MQPKLTPNNESQKSAATANQVLTAKLHLTYAVPGAPQPELSWFKHFFGKVRHSLCSSRSSSLTECVRDRNFRRIQMALRESCISRRFDRDRGRKRSNPR